MRHNTENQLQWHESLGAHTGQTNRQRDGQSDARARPVMWLIRTAKD